jgi:hypothetical protein
VETTSFGKKLFFMVKFPEFLGSPMYVYLLNWFENSIIHTNVKYTLFTTKEK